MVYFVQIPDGRIKIGTTTNFLERRKDLEFRFGRPVVLMAIIPGTPRDERALHRRFDALRFSGTELFSPARELINFIESLPGPVVRDVTTLEMEPRRKQVGLRIHPDIRRRLKIAAATAGMTMEDLLHQILVRELGQQGLLPTSFVEASAG